MFTRPPPPPARSLVAAPCLCPEAKEQKSSFEDWRLRFQEFIVGTAAASFVG